MGRSREPLLWALFSGGGMAAALVLPALALLLWTAAPLGWIEVPTREGFLEIAGFWPARLGLLGLIVLCLFHWAHRFRYTLYDGLQLYHLNPLIAALTYGVACLLSAAAIWVLATL